MAQKALGGGDFAKTPNGGAGVQNRAELVYTYAVKAGRLSLPQMAAQLSANAARLVDRYPQKGRIAPGCDADIAIYDPRGAHAISYRTNAHNCDNSPFEGVPVNGGVRDVLLNGEPVVQGGRLVHRGAGRYVFRGPSQRPRR